MARCVRASDGNVLFWCPGCECAHAISDAPGRWKFNGDLEAPTISPSIEGCTYTDARKTGRALGGSATAPATGE